MLPNTKLIKYIKDINLRLDPISADPIYFHVGAVVVDSILQSGLKYVSVVLPRVYKVIETYASFSTSSKFFQLIKRYGIENIIEFKNERKNKLIQMILRLFIEEKVETVEEISDWLKNDTNILKLLSLKGIGNKTVDYMKKLVGIDTIPIDRHLINFLEKANIDCIEYVQTQNLYMDVASKMNINLVTLDNAVWSYMANYKN